MLFACWWLVAPARKAWAWGSQRSGRGGVFASFGSVATGARDAPGPPTGGGLSALGMANIEHMFVNSVPRGVVSPLASSVDGCQSADTAARS